MFFIYCRLSNGVEYYYGERHPVTEFNFHPLNEMWKIRPLRYATKAEAEKQLGKIRLQENVVYEVREWPFTETIP